MTIGQRYIVNPASPITFFPPDGDLSKISGLTTAAAWKAYAADLNKAGAGRAPAGLRFGFHNHFWELAPLEDDTPLTGFDILIAETDPRLVHFEVDLYWAWFAHRDPVGLLAQVGDRIRQFHVKDMKFVNHTATFTDPGTGVIDFARIFRAAGDRASHEYIVERDDAGRERAQDRRGRLQLPQPDPVLTAGAVDPAQKTVAQSFLMLTTVQPSVAARSSACSAPAV